MPHIYKITNKVNSKIYIGKTSHTTIEQRFKEHLNDAKKPNIINRPLYKAINKYGSGNFAIELIETVETDEEACKREEYWINHYRTYIGFSDCNGYNATLGGDGKQYIDKRLIKEALQHCSFKTVEEIAKDIGCCKDLVYDVARQNNIKLKTTHDIMRDKLKKQINQIDLLTGKILNTFESVQEACTYLKEKDATIHSELNAMRSMISQCANGKKSKAFGFGWEYI